MLINLKSLNIYLCHLGLASEASVLAQIPGGYNKPAVTHNQRTECRVYNVTSNGNVSVLVKNKNTKIDLLANTH